MQSKMIRTLLVTVVLQCALAATVLAYEDLDDFASSRATNINADLQANYYMSSLDDVEDWYVDQQAYWLTFPLPGTDPWTQSSSPSHVPVDWSSLSSTFTSQLVPDTQYGVNVYPLTIKEDFTTHQVEYWVGSSCIHTMAFRTGYDWTMYTPGGGDTNMYNPSRVIIAATLVKDNEMYTYLYNEGFEVGASLATADEDSEFLEDTDGDGWSNRDEIKYGTDPYDPGDLPAITRIVDSGSGVDIEWAAPTNRWYQLQSTTNLITQSFSDVGSLLMGNGSVLTNTDGSSDGVKFWQYKVEEADVNNNNLPDWWEYKYWGMLTTNSLTGDEVDNDGLDNSEELYFGYSPLVSERELIHSIYHTVSVVTNVANPDTGDERFDFHGGGRSLSLAQGAIDEDWDPDTWWGNNYPTVYGRGAEKSAGILFNNDEENLYVGISGLHRGDDNAFILFIDSSDGGVTNLGHLSGQPDALGTADNITFDATEFTPNVAIIIGSISNDAKNTIAAKVGGNTVGQGVYALTESSTINDFPGFSRSASGATFSQWKGGSNGDQADGGIEVALALTNLNCYPGDIIKVAGIFVGGTLSTNRWVAGEVYGKSVGATYFANTHIIGASVQLADAGQTLPNVAYAGLSEDAVLLQAFYWDVLPDDGQWWNILNSQVIPLSQAGFTHFWLPPMCKASNAGGSVGYDPYDHYDLGQYYQAGGDWTPFTRTRYGIRSHLETLIANMQTNGIVPIADIVLNHMTGGEDLGVTYTNYATHTDAPQFNKTADDFHPSTNAHNDLVFPYHHNEGFGTVVETNSYGVDVAFLSPNMRLGLKHWGNWLANTIGIQGWRLDFTEGVEPWYIWEWLHYRGIRDGFAFIEYWEESDGREMQEWIDLIGRKAAIYDSHLRSMLKEMCEDGASFDMRQLNAPSLLGLEPGHVVVYLDNHDTFRRNDLSKLGIQANKPLGYAYLFHSKGYPLVFWRDYYDFAYLNNDGTPNWSIKIPEEIDRLIAIRKVTVGGSLKFLYADDDLYIQQRDGGESKSGSILVMNDSSTIKSNSVQTMWINTDIIDLVDTNSPHQVTTDGSGYAYLEAPGEGYRIYAPTNVMEQVNNWRTGP